MTKEDEGEGRTGKVLKKITAGARENNNGDTAPLLEDYRNEISLLGEIREIHDKSGDDFIKKRLEHVKSVFTQPSLTSHCDTLPQHYDPPKYKQIHLACEKIDERKFNLYEQFGEVKKRMNDSWTNLITTSVAIVVISTTGALNSMSTSTIITNLSPIVLNLLLSYRALFAARQERNSLEEKEKNLTRDYKLQRWQLDQYETSKPSVYKKEKTKNSNTKPSVYKKEKTKNSNAESVASGEMDGWDTSGVADNVSNDEESGRVSSGGIGGTETSGASDLDPGYTQGGEEVQYDVNNSNAGGVSSRG